MTEDMKHELVTPMVPGGTHDDDPTDLIEKIPWYRNGLMTRLTYLVLGSLVVLSFSSVTAIPNLKNSIDLNTQAIEMTSLSDQEEHEQFRADIEGIDDEMKELVTKEDLDRRFTDLKDWMKALIGSDTDIEELMEWLDKQR